MRTKSPSLTTQETEALGRELFGANWPRAMAGALGVGRPTVYRWRERTGLPLSYLPALGRALHAEAARLKKHAARFERLAQPHKSDRKAALIPSADGNSLPLLWLSPGGCVCDLRRGGRL